MYADRYFFTWLADRDTRIIGGLPDEYECIIQQLDYVGAIEEIQAQQFPVQIVYQNTTDDPLQAIRGSECTLNLIATADFQLEDLYTENEREFLVLIYRNGSIIWRGFIIPDGCQEQFMFAPYNVSINAVDTLGLLKNLSYVQNDGNFWLGPQSFIEVIYNCLNRVAIPDMLLYTSVNIYEVSQPQGDNFDPLGMTYIMAERYLKDDGINPMNCEEVLRSVLESWTATIIQSEGDFYIFRPNELALSSTLAFRRYIDGQMPYGGFSVTKNLAVRLGGESEGEILAPLFHINEDQLKMIVKPFKNASMSYIYGENKNLEEQLDNPTFIGVGAGCGGDPVDPCDSVTIPGWTKTGTMYAGIWPTGGVIFYDDTPVDVSNYYANDSVFTAGINFRLRLIIDWLNPGSLYGTDMNFGIEFYDGLNTYYLQEDDQTWQTGLGAKDYYTVRSDNVETGQLTIESAVVPSEGQITIKIYAPSNPANNIVYKKISAAIFQDLGLVIGEVHTATQRGKFSFVPETLQVLNGDSFLKQYLGAMYLSDQTTLTTKWVRRGLPESIDAEPYEAEKEFLRIAVEETQRMHALPYVRFDGSIFGYFNPLSRFAINLLVGHFMTLALTYDLQSNICRSTLIRISNEEIPMDYTLVPDYGETTKVTVNATSP